MREALGELDLRSLSAFSQVSGESAASASKNAIEVEVLEDPLFAAAKGAALYARWRQEIPWDYQREACSANC
jgi:hypothetical protein